MNGVLETTFCSQITFGQAGRGSCYLENTWTGERLGQHGQLSAILHLCGRISETPQKDYRL